VKDKLSYDFAGLFYSLVKKGESIAHIGYYVGQIDREGTDDERSEKLFRNQQRLFSLLQLQIPNIKIEKGRIVARGDTYQEKGVDVKLAIDMITLALEEKIDTAILISSDTDLIPAVLTLKRKGISTRYVGLENRPSIAMAKHCEQFLLKPKDIYAFAKTQPKEKILKPRKIASKPKPNSKDKNAKPKRFKQFRYHKKPLKKDSGNDLSNPATDILKQKDL
jgi:uncharacterized LabA/DUF88 family protein